MLLIKKHNPKLHTKTDSVLENRALLQMASSFAQVGEEEIPQIFSDSIPTNSKRQTAWSVSIFKGNKTIEILAVLFCKTYLSFAKNR